MYVPAANFEEEQDQEILCVLTGERYVHLQGDEKSIIDPKMLAGAVETLPDRFYFTPFVVHKGNGQVRVFGNINK
jgi:hypothetical protein